MVRAGSWLTEFVSREAGVPVDSSEHESGSNGVGGLSEVGYVARTLFILRPLLID